MALANRPSGLRLSVKHNAMEPAKIEIDWTPKRKLSLEASLSALPARAVGGMVAAKQPAFLNWPQAKLVDDDSSPLSALSAATTRLEHEGPREQDLRGCLFEPLAPPPAGGVTTLMVRHIPDVVTQDYFMLEIDGADFEGLYDFMHVRTDLRSRHNANRGIAFINFVTPEVASEFSEAFHGRCLALAGEQPPGCASLEVLPAKIQGFNDNAAQHYLSAGGLGRGGPKRTRPLFLPRTSETRAQLQALQSSCGFRPSWRPRAAPGVAVHAQH